MKKLSLGKIALATFGAAFAVTSASAADLAPRPYTKAPPMMAAIYDWSGFYIGANGGYGSSRKCFQDVAGGLVTADNGCHDADGAVAGGQIGYRWQSGSIVYGLEAQGDWSDMRGSNVSPALPLATVRSRLDAFGLFTGQIGYAWNNALLYAKGGASLTSNRYAVLATGTSTVLADARDNSRIGATAGVGLEYGFSPNWSAAVEYNHLFVERRDIGFSTTAGFVGTERIRGDADIITARINYRWGGPVVARY